MKEIPQLQHLTQGIAENGVMQCSNDERLCSRHLETVSLVLPKDPGTSGVIDKTTAQPRKDLKKRQWVMIQSLFGARSTDQLRLQYRSEFGEKIQGSAGSKWSLWLCGIFSMTRVAKDQ